MTLPARTTEFFPDYHVAMEAFIEERWSDGLPVMLPTPDLVDAMIAGGGRPADEVIGVVPVREIPLRVWEAATSAVMAGCKPEYFPVVLATWDALMDPAYNLHTALSSTGGAAIACVVSGPYAEKIGMNSSTGLLSPGNRANATIGRAIRIGALTALKAIPGELDLSAFGHAGKLGFHFAEAEPPKGWPTLREQKGFSRNDTTVTVLAADAPHQISQRWAPTADQYLQTVACAMRDLSSNGAGTGTTYMLALGPEHSGLLADAGMTPQSIAARLSELSAITVEDMLRAGIEHAKARVFYGEPDERGFLCNATPENIMVFVAGGPGSGWSALISGFAPAKVTSAVTRAVRLPG
jgi:hypothetical protein